MTAEAPDADRFDRLASTYDQAVPFFAVAGRRLVEWAGVTPGQRVLDLGAGRGAVSSAVCELCGAGANVVAGDVSEQMLARLRELDLPGTDVVQIDATAIAQPDSSFDVVFCAFVLHFLAGRAQALSEVARVLRPTGVFAMSVPGPALGEGWWADYNLIIDEFRQRAQMGARVPLPADIWDTLSAAAGLRVLQVETVDVVVPLEGPEQHCDWLLAHSYRGLHDALDVAGQAELRRQVLRSLREHHPSAGRHLLTNATFYRMAKLTG